MYLSFCYNKRDFYSVGDVMLDSFDFDIISNPIDINKLLEEMDLPIRIVNTIKEEKFYSEESFYKYVDKLLLGYTSNYLFPNKLVSFYPQVRERKASKELKCNLSGAIIKKGSLYYTYHPFIEVLESGRVYTIKKDINAECGFVDLFPQDLFTYEEWYYKIKNAYFVEDDKIDFYGLSVNCGDNCLQPYLLGKSKKKVKL